MKTSIVYGVFVLLAACSSGTIVTEGDERKPVIDNWENVAIYYAPPADYETIGMVTGKGKGIGDQSKMENAIEGMKEQARDAGATGVLIQSAELTTAGKVGVANVTANGSSAFGVGVAVPIVRGTATGVAIYVPEDAAAFLKAKQDHETACSALSSNEDAAEAAVKAAKKGKDPAAVDTAKQNLQAVEDQEDAQFCGRSAWYADLMASKQQLMDKMRAEDQASKDADKNAAQAALEQQCLAAAQKNDLATWRKLGCK